MRLYASLIGYFTADVYAFFQAIMCDHRPRALSDVSCRQWLGRKARAEFIYRQQHKVEQWIRLDDAASMSLHFDITCD